MGIRPLPEVLQKKAQEELNEDQNRILDDLNHIRNWISKQPHLTAREDDQFLIAFLRGCKFSIQKTKAKLDLYYSFRKLLPDFFSDRNPYLPEIQTILCAGPVINLPQRQNSDKPIILLCRYSACNFETMPLVNLHKMIFLNLDILLNECDNTTISGLQIVVDYKGFDSRYLLHITPTRAKSFLTCLQSAYPIRLKGFFCINVPKMFDTIYTMAKPFLNKKFNNRIHVYSENNIDDFYKDIGQNNLPKEYGGQNSSVSQLAADFKEKVEQYQKWLLEDEQFYTDERLRPPYSENDPYSVLGMEGSFRKLAID